MSGTELEAALALFWLENQCSQGFLRKGLGNKIVAEVRKSIPSLGEFVGWSVFMCLVFWFSLGVSGILLCTSDLFSMANKLLPC